MLDETYVHEKYRFDLPWDSRSNQQLAEQVGCISAFHSPAAHPNPHLETDYVAVTGPGTLWDSEPPIAFRDIEPFAANLIVVVEIKESSIHWMSPHDLPIEMLSSSGDQSVKIGNILFADGTVWYVGENCPLEAIATLSTLQGAKESSREELLGRRR